MGQLEVNRVHFELPLPSNQPLMAAGNDAGADVFVPVLFSFASSRTDKTRLFPSHFCSQRDRRAGRIVGIDEYFFRTG